MPKIIHCIPSLDVGGAEHLLHWWLRHGDRKRFEPVVVSLTTVGPIGELIRRDGVRVVPLGMARRAALPVAVWKLAQLLRDERADLLQTHLYPANAVGLMSGALCGVPVVCSIQCSNMEWRYYKLGTYMGFRLNALLSPLAAAFWLNSEAGLRYHRAHGLRARRVFLLPNGFEVGRFRPDPEARLDVRRELGVPPDRYLVGRFARLDPMKDHATFMQSALLLAARRPDVDFVLAGSNVTPAHEPFRTPLHSSPHAGRFHLLGRRDDVARLTAALDVSVSSSSFGEGFPNILGEAMSCEVPCIATDVGGCADVVGGTGRVVPPRSPQLLADAIHEMLDLGREGLAALGARARKRIEERFDMRAIVRRLETIYDDVLTPGRGRA